MESYCSLFNYPLGIILIAGWCYVHFYYCQLHETTLPPIVRRFCVRYHCTHTIDSLRGPGHIFYRHSGRWKKYINEKQGIWRIKQGTDKNWTLIGKQKVTNIDYNTVAPYYIISLLDKTTYFPDSPLFEKIFERAVMWRQFVSFEEFVKPQRSLNFQVCIYLWIVYPLSRITFDADSMIYFIQ